MTPQQLPPPPQTPPPGMSPFTHPENPLLNQLHETDPDTPLADLPEIDPQYRQAELPLDEQAAAQNGSQPSGGPQPAGMADVARAAGQGAQPAAGVFQSPANDRALLAQLQQDAINRAHGQMALATDVKRARQAIMLLAIGVAIGAALVMLAALQHKRRQAALAGDVTGGVEA